jgi:hypothetical protein
MQVGELILISQGHIAQGLVSLNVSPRPDFLPFNYPTQIVILILRTYAICNKSKPILAILLSTQIIASSMSFYYTAGFLGSLHCEWTKIIECSNFVGLMVD